MPDPGSGSAVSIQNKHWTNLHYQLRITYHHILNPILIMYIFFLKYVDPDSMETNEKTKTFSTKSLKDEHGNYPVWMSMRRVQKQQKKKQSSGLGSKIRKEKSP